MYEFSDVLFYGELPVDGSMICSAPLVLPTFNKLNVCPFLAIPEFYAVDGTQRFFFLVFFIPLVEKLSRLISSR